MITPSATSPASSRIRGPRPAIRIGMVGRARKSRWPPWNCTTRPACVTVSPAHRRRIRLTASRMAVAGW